MAAPIVTPPQGAQKPVAVDPYASPAEYLQAKGWKNMGPPDWESTVWLDPSKPLVARYEKIPIMAPHLADDGQSVEVRQVEVQNPKNSGQSKILGYQVAFHPPVEGVPLRHALQAELERQRLEELKEARKGSLHVPGENPNKTVFQPTGTGFESRK